MPGFKKDRVYPEHLIDLVIAADAVRRKALDMAPARYKRSQRIWIEPWFNALGTLWGKCHGLFPWPWRRRIDLWICAAMAGHPPEENPDLLERKSQAVALAQFLEQTTGQRPAMLVLTSHPETTGPLHWLRFELLRQGLEVADAVVEAGPGGLFKSHPQCFLAIDPYALDTVSPAVGGFYAAWMHHVYMAWDRQPSTQSWTQRHLFLRHSGYGPLLWRLLRRLRRNIPILMMLPGGLPHNARMLYGAREFIQQIPARHGSFSKRAAEKKIMQILMTPVNGVRPAEQGELPPAAAAAVRELFSECGLDPSEVNKAFEEFAAEFQRAVPYRRRLFKILCNRLARRGKPLLLVAAAHSSEKPYVRIAIPWGIYRGSDGSLQIRRGTLSEPLASPSMAAEQFSKLYL